MKDYWNNLSLREAWSKKERFNFIMKYIDEKAGSTDTETPEPTPEEPTITIADISVSVKNSDGKGIGNASVVVSDNVSEYTGSTGSAGGCTVRGVLLGDYTITTSADGYITSVDDFTVTDGENVFEVVLEEEVDDDF